MLDASITTGLLSFIDLTTGFDDIRNVDKNSTVKSAISRALGKFKDDLPGVDGNSNSLVFFTFN